MKFKVGDKVKFVDEELAKSDINISVLLNKVGTITSKAGGKYYVEFRFGAVKGSMWCSEKSLKSDKPELTAMEFLEKYNKICESYICCDDCPLSRRNNKFNRSCNALCKLRPAEAIRIVTEWEEPKQIKTIMDDFFEKFPKAAKEEDGTPSSCAAYIYNLGDCCYDCAKCWCTPLSETEETK